MNMKFFTAVASVLAFAVLSAEELPVANPFNQLQKEWNAGTMTGKNSHAAVIKEKEYPDCWQYWYIEGGEKPENFVLKPMTALAPDSQSAKEWKQSLVVAFPTKTGFAMPFLYKFTCMLPMDSKRNGAAYSFKNPFDKKVTLYLDGNFWHEPEAKIYIYVKHTDGTMKLLCDDSNPDAVHVEYNKFPDGKIIPRHYVKLQYETEFLPGDTLIFSGIRTQEMITKNKKSCCVFRISGWGDKWNPVIVIDDGK